VQVLVKAQTYELQRWCQSRALFSANALQQEIAEAISVRWGRRVADSRGATRRVVGHGSP
jgi:hypothetical protein